MKAFGDTYRSFPGSGFAVVIVPCLLAALPAVTVETRLGAPSPWRQEGLSALRSVGKEGIHGTPTVALPHDYAPTKQMSLARRPGNPQRRSLFSGRREGSDQGTRSASPRLINHYLGHQALNRLGKTKLYGIPAFVQRRSELASSGSRSPQELMTPSGPVSASGEYQQGHREQGAGGIGAGAGPEVLGPWVVPRNVRVKNSELAAGRQELLAIARELFFPGGADTETGHSPGEAMPLLLPPPGGEQAELAFEKLFPVDTVYHCRDENGQFKVLGVGRVLAVGSSGVVCLAADITDLTRARKYAAKFYYSLLVLDSESDIKYGNSVIIQTERRARSSREKLLSKVSSEQELLQHGVAVPRGFYTLDWSRRPPPRQMNTPLITSVRKGGGSFTTSYVLFGSHVMVMPLLGPDLFHIFQRDRTDNVLKYTFVMLVRRVAYLNSLGLVHRDIKPSNIAVSPETGELFLADLEFVGDMGAESRCQDYLSRRYVAPERAKCIVEGTAKYLVDEWVDSWALGVSLYFILCGSDLPFGHFEVSTAEDLLERYQENFKILLQSLNRETFMGDRCPRMKESHVALMDIVRLLLDPHKPTRWTARRLVQEHPFFQVAQD